MTMLKEGELTAGAAASAEHAEAAESTAGAENL